MKTQSLLVWGFVGLLGVAIAGNVLHSCDIQTPSPKVAEAPASSAIASPLPSCPAGSKAAHWESAAGDLWSGVQLYQGAGDCKTLLATVLGGNQADDHVKLSYVNKDTEWKARAAVGQQTFVDRNDPATRSKQWTVLNYP